MTSELRIDGLEASAGGAPVLHGVDLVVRSGEVHVVMGPNGSGKSTLSHVLMGRPGYEVTAGSVHLDGVDLLALEPWQRAHAGLFLAMQYPVEVPGVSLQELLLEATRGLGREVDEVPDRLRAEAERIGFSKALLARPVNVDLSGGEKKRSETVQLAVLAPRIAVLDELDSGLDVDALRACAQRVEAETEERGLGVLAITHYQRLLDVLRADVVHVLAAGRIVASGGPELAEELERTGYGEYVKEEPSEVAVGLSVRGRPNTAAPDEDPFADPLA